MLMIIGVLLIDVLAIVLFLRDALNPRSFLIMNSVQTGFWGGVLLMDLVAMARGANAAGIALTIGIFLTFVGLLVYASVNYHRAKKQAQRGHYAAAHNPSAAGPAHQNPHAQSTAYYPTTNAPVELYNQDPPLYQPPSYQPPHGAAADYYSQQPTKPAQIV